MEKFTYKILKDNNFEFIAEKKFQNPQVKFFPYDIYICGYNLLIEIDGKQHFEKIDYFEQGNYTFEKRVNRDNLKNNFAFINDIPILRIPYIYYAPQNRGQIERIIKEFISTRKVPDDILDYYKKLRFSNYYEIGRRLNEFQGGYNLMTNPC